MSLLPTEPAPMERAITYALSVAQSVRPDALDARTPCAEWDLRQVLLHLTDSLDVVQESVDAGRVGPGGAGRESSVDVLGSFRGRAGRLLAAWTSSGHRERMVAVADRALPSCLVAHTGALEIVVHSWDISQACGHEAAVPTALAEDMVRISRIVVTNEIRPSLFGAPVSVPESAGPSDRLLAYLGRDPAKRVPQV